MTIRFALPSPSAAAVIKPSVDLTPPRPRLKPGPDTKYSDDTLAAAKRCHAKGVSIKETAELLGLTTEQVRYLRYVRPKMVEGNTTPPAPRKPLKAIVPDPVTAGHFNTLPSHKWYDADRIEHRTRYRSDLIRQAQMCHGHGYSATEVSQHFKTKPSAIMYFWYHLGKRVSHEQD